MVFSNLIFLYLFLPMSVLLYLLAPNLRWKNMALLATSIVFYAWGEPVYVLLMVAVAYANYLAGCKMAERPKVVLKGIIGFDLLMLVVFKYAGFLTEAINQLIGLALPVPKLTLPIGISFYTFQAMSYVIDVYRQRVQPERSFAQFFMYVAMFPQLIAGPIVRYSDICRQLSKRKTTAEDAFYGMMRFCMGLGKKVLLADYLGRLADEIFAKELTVVGAWLGAIALMLQIYFDFSGYSDMAIGMGRIFGFRYRENFDLPYIASSIGEFWRRWHISLSSFFRDYVYIPLGGNRKGMPRQILNLLIVWSLTGLWHGASWNYVIWGVYFFVLLTMEKLLHAWIERIPIVFRHLATLLLLLFGWVIFHFENPNEMLRVFSAMFGNASWSNTMMQAKLISAIPLLLVSVFAASGLPRKLGFVWNAVIGGGFADAYGKNVLASGLQLLNCLLIFAYCGAIMYFCTVALVGSGFSPFLYFRF